MIGASSHRFSIRRRFFLSVLFALIFTFAVTPPRAAAPSASPIRHVILVSIDGLMPAAYLSPDTYNLKVPTLRELARTGAASPGVTSVFPTVTYPAHTSIVTGARPGTHGITTNSAPDPLNKNNGGWRWYAEDIQVPTLWGVARAANLRTALVWWPVTAGARATVVAPEIWRASTPEDAKLARAVATPGLFAEVEKRFPGTNARFSPPGVPDDVLTNVAVHILESQKPNLLLLHIFQVDHEQHETGAFGPTALPAIEFADAQLARLIAAAKSAGIWPHTALIVVSDHGFLPITTRMRLGVLFRELGLVTIEKDGSISNWKATAISNSGSAYIYLNNAQDEPTKTLLRETFAQLAATPASGVGRVLTQKEIAAEGGDPRAFLAVEAADGFAFAAGYSGEKHTPSRQKGAHGYLPGREEMKASLLIAGPGIAPQKIEGARLTDVGPTAAAMLGLKLEKAEGKPLAIRRR